MNRTPLLVAHRGVPARAPENSARAFREALAAGARVVELDARPSADGALVVCHDPVPERLTGVTTPIEQMGWREATRLAYRADAGERLLTLDEALALLAGRTTIDIEVKSDTSAPPLARARALFEALERAGSPADVLATSDDPEFLAHLADHGPALRRGVIARGRHDTDPIAMARQARADLVVVNRTRLEGTDLLERLLAEGLEVWVYVVDDPAGARDLLARGVHGLVTDDYPSLRRALDEAGADPVRPRRRSPDPTLVALDLGSTSVKGALVSVRGGIVARAARPTPVRREAEKVTHDPQQVLEAVRAVLAALAQQAESPPLAAAIASQRSTGLWVDPATLEPWTEAVSWRDRRGRSVVEALRSERRRLEAIADLPLAPAWTGILGAALKRDRQIRGGLLLPLGAWIAAQLTGSAPRVDPSLAQRTFLYAPAEGSWSDELVRRLGLAREELPAIVESAGEWGTIRWPGRDEPVALRAVIGDQQAAYIGAVGPIGRGLVVNAGTALFVMRTGTAREPVPAGGRRSPLWTSESRPEVSRYLIEIPIRWPPFDAVREIGLARALARALLAGDDPAPDRLAARLERALVRLRGPHDKSFALAGGMASSPHLAHLLARRLPLAVRPLVEPEITLLGAARLAAAAARLPWSVPVTARAGW